MSFTPNAVRIACPIHIDMLDVVQIHSDHTGRLGGLDEGDLISRGQVLAELGDHQVNGGWAPHLHFQIMLDIQGRTGDFPGVCKVSERAKWEEICPSPYPLLGLELG